MLCSPKLSRESEQSFGADEVRREREWNERKKKVCWGETLPGKKALLAHKKRKKHKLFSFQVSYVAARTIKICRILLKWISRIRTFVC